MRRNWSKLGFLLAILVLLLASVSATAVPQSASPDRIAKWQRVVSRDVPLAEQEAAAALVTEEVLAQAQPLPMPALDESAFADEDLIVGPTGPFGFAPSGLSEEDLAASVGALDLSGEAELAAPTPLDAYSYPPPFTRYAVNKHTYMWQQFPWKAMGKLLFQKPGSASWYYCTASVMYGRALWTAGHCVYTKGLGWHKNMSFVPAYRDGAAPYGTWTVTQLATLTGWQSGNYAYDIGAAVVRDLGGKKISQVVGYLGAMWNASATQHFHAFGLPSNIDSGKYLQCCAASTNRRDAMSGPDPIGIGCDMLHGSSGGPRVVSYKPYESGANNYVNGVNSYYYTDKPKQVYSAYFDTGAKNLSDGGKPK
ncbi:MAG: trypsin-like serine peptidase [Anaerolineae bacterium]